MTSFILMSKNGLISKRIRLSCQNVVKLAQESYFKADIFIDLELDPEVDLEQETVKPHILPHPH